jgi:hypothetical protein
MKRPDYSRLVAPSFLAGQWFSVLSEFVATDPTSTTRNTATLIVIITVLISLSSWGWYSDQLFMHRSSLQGIPIVTSVVNLPQLDKVQEWTPSQVLQWIISLEVEWRYRLIPIVAPHHITGGVLLRLEQQDWTAMGVPLGDAIRLVQNAQQLCNTSSHRQIEPNQKEEEQDLVQEWLGPAKPLKRVDTSSPNQTDPLEHNQETMERAKQIMQERYGLQLPEVTIPQSNDEVDNAQESLSSENALLEDLLLAMPQHIREIAIRKPELVQELWTTHEMLGSRNTYDPERIRKLITTETRRAAQTHWPQNVSDEVSNDEDEETTRLLRKRPTSNARYASIG